MRTAGRTTAEKWTTRRSWEPRSVGLEGNDGREPRKKGARGHDREGSNEKVQEGASTTRRSPADGLARELGELIDAARQKVAQAANAALTTLYWEIGTRIRRDLLKEKRAEYGAEIVAAVGRRLEERSGRDFGEKGLRRMLQFAEACPDPAIVAALRRQSGWTHFKLLIPMRDPLKRDFYAELCRAEGWSTRTLDQKINSMLYERTALSRKPEKLIRKELAASRNGGAVGPDLVFQDPYLLDFQGPKDAFSKKDLEAALLREIERFLLKLGTGFAFVERQKRITLDGDDYDLDLLFSHRRMRRLLVAELKIGEFKPADAGQVALCLKCLERHERQPGEEAPVAIILCAGRKEETVEYLDLWRSGIHVAEYLTELPPRDVLRARFHEALKRARQRLLERAGPTAAIAGPAPAAARGRPLGRLKRS